MNADEDCDWLHRNNMYQMHEIGGQMRPVNIPNAIPYVATPVERDIMCRLNKPGDLSGAVVFHGSRHRLRQAL